MVWVIIVLVLIVVAVLLRVGEPAFPLNARRRSRSRGRVNVARPVNDSVPDLSVFAGSWHGGDSDCHASGDSGTSDSCSDSSTSD